MTYIFSVFKTIPNSFLFDSYAPGFCCRYFLEVYIHNVFTLVTSELGKLVPIIVPVLIFTNYQPLIVTFGDIGLLPLNC